MENEKNLNQKSTAQELPDESLDDIAGGANYGSVCYCFKPGDKVKFTPWDNSTLYLIGEVQCSYLKEYNGRTIPHYMIIVNHYTGSDTYLDIPQDRVKFA